MPNRTDSGYGSDSARSSAQSITAVRKSIIKKLSKLFHSGPNEKAMLSRLSKLSAEAASDPFGKKAREITGKGAVCWDGVAKLQKMAGMIPDSNFQNVLRKTRAQSYGNFLGESPKLISSIEDLRHIHIGSRLGFIHPETKMLTHAMVSLGEGNAAGFKNATLGFGDPVAWEQHNLLKVLNFKGGSDQVATPDKQQFLLYASEYDHVASAKAHHERLIHFQRAQEETVKLFHESVRSQLGDGAQEQWAPQSLFLGADDVDVKGQCVSVSLGYHAALIEDYRRAYFEALHTYANLISSDMRSVREQAQAENFHNEMAQLEEKGQNLIQNGASDAQGLLHKVGSDQSLAESLKPLGASGTDAVHLSLTTGNHSLAVARTYDAIQKAYTFYFLDPNVGETRFSSAHAGDYNKLVGFIQDYFSRSQGGEGLADYYAAKNAGGQLSFDVYKVNTKGVQADGSLGAIKRFLTQDSDFESDNGRLAVVPSDVVEVRGYKQQLQEANSQAIKWGDLVEEVYQKQGLDKQRYTPSFEAEQLGSNQSKIAFINNETGEKVWHTVNSEVPVELKETIKRQTSTLNKTLTAAGGSAESSGADGFGFAAMGIVSSILSLTARRMGSRSSITMAQMWMGISTGVLDLGTTALMEAPSVLQMMNVSAKILRTATRVANVVGKVMMPLTIGLTIVSIFMDAAGTNFDNEAEVSLFINNTISSLVQTGFFVATTIAGLMGASSASVLGPLGVPLADVFTGISFLVEAYVKNLQTVSNSLKVLDLSFTTYTDKPFKLDDKNGLNVGLQSSSSMINRVDFKTGKVGYADLVFEKLENNYTTLNATGMVSGYDNYSFTDGAHKSGDYSISSLEALHKGKDYSQDFDTSSTKPYLLPVGVGNASLQVKSSTVVAEGALFWKTGDHPGMWEVEEIQKYYANKLGYPAFLWRDYHGTIVPQTFGRKFAVQYEHIQPIVVQLDRKDRTLILPTIDDKTERDRTKYRIVGGKGRVNIVLPLCEYQLSTQIECGSLQELITLNITNLTADTKKVVKPSVKYDLAKHHLGDQYNQKVSEALNDNSKIAWVRSGTKKRHHRFFLSRDKVVINGYEVWLSGTTKPKRLILQDEFASGNGDAVMLLADCNLTNGSINQVVTVSQFLSVDVINTVKQYLSLTQFDQLIIKDAEGKTLPVRFESDQSYMEVNFEGGYYFIQPKNANPYASTLGRHNVSVHYYGDGRPNGFNRNAFSFNGITSVLSSQDAQNTMNVITMHQGVKMTYSGYHYVSDTDMYHMSRFKISAIGFEAAISDELLETFLYRTTEALFVEWSEKVLSRRNIYTEYDDVLVRAPSQRGDVYTFRLRSAGRGSMRIKDFKLYSIELNDNQVGMHVQDGIINLYSLPKTATQLDLSKIKLPASAMYRDTRIVIDDQTTEITLPKVLLTTRLFIEKSHAVSTVDTPMTIKLPASELSGTTVVQWCKQDEAYQLSLSGYPALQLMIPEPLIDDVTLELGGSEVVHVKQGVIDQAATNGSEIASMGIPGTLVWSDKDYGVYFNATTGLVVLKEHASGIALPIWPELLIRQVEVVGSWVDVVDVSGHQYSYDLVYGRYYTRPSQIFNRIGDAVTLAYTQPIAEGDNILIDWEGNQTTVTLVGSDNRLKHPDVNIGSTSLNHDTGGILLKGAVAKLVAK